MTTQEPSAASTRWLLLAGVWLVYGTFGLVMASLAPLVDQIVGDLQLSHRAMGLTLGAWQLVYIAAAIPAGTLLDRFPARWTLSAGALLVAASAFGRGFASDGWTLLAAVMLFGLGGPIISAGAPKVIARYFNGSERGLAMGIYMTGPALGGIVALVSTHALLLPAFDGNWRPVLMLWALLAALSAVLWFLLATAFDRPALASNHGGDDSAAATAADPPRVLLRNRAVRLVMVMSVGVFLINHGLNNWLPTVLGEGGLNAVHAGYWAAFPTFIGILGSLLIPRLATPARRLPILFGLAVAAIGACLLLALPGQPGLPAALLLQGIARSSLMTVLMLTLVELPSIGARNAGTASGLFFAAAEVGGAFGPFLMGLLFDMTGTFAPGLYLLAGTGCALLLGVRLLQRELR
ncbi:MAG: MFS transporter [Pseudomonadota bacterium]